jgi:hypothetical protein
VTGAQPYDNSGPLAQPKIIPAVGGRSLIHASMNPSCWFPSEPVSPLAEWLSAAPGLLYPGFTRVAVDATVNYGAQRTVGSLVGFAVVNFTQAANVCSDSLTQTTLAAGAGRTAATLPFTSDCAWTASSSAPWLQVYPLNGIGTVPVRYTVFPNFGTTVRTATITIGNRTFTVTQAPSTGTVTERFVKLLYFNFFGRLPSDAEVAFQVNSGLSREQLALNFFNSQEFSSGGRFIAGLYVGILNRDAEYGGWLFQRDALASGITDQSSVVDNFLNSSEFRLRYLTLTDAAFVSLMYSQVLRRTASQGEIQFQAAAIAAGLSRSAFARNLLNSVEFSLGATPRLNTMLSYACLLQRDPSPSEYNAALAQSTTIQAIPDPTARQNAWRDQLLAPRVNGAELQSVLQ